jgi:alkylation response protein AidB-like acyl-CoA dehydrogenase
VADRIPTEASEVLAAVERLVPLARSLADEADALRRTPDALFDGLVGAGVVRISAPRVYGGSELEPHALLEVVETLARADGCAGWMAMVSGLTGMTAAYMPEATARELYRDGPDLLLAGALAPRGKAVSVEGGYRVTGRWPFASGCQHSRWLVANALVASADGPPALRMCLFPETDAKILDTWHVAGLEGTGSHDIELRDCFVPDARAFAFGVPVQDTPLYRFPTFGLLSIAVSAVALGIARCAVDELGRLAGEKVSAFGSQTLAQQALGQQAISRAETHVGSARAYLHERVARSWETVLRGDAVTVAERAKLRLAATNATRASADAVDLAYDAGGGSSLYAKSPLQRCLRDVRAVTQHTVVGPATYELAGKALLGLDADISML